MGNGRDIVRWRRRGGWRWRERNEEEKGREIEKEGISMSEYYRGRKSRENSEETKEF